MIFLIIYFKKMCTKETGSEELVVATPEEVETAIGFFAKRAKKLTDRYGKIDLNNPDNPFDQGLRRAIAYMRKAKRSGKVISSWIVIQLDKKTPISIGVLSLQFFYFSIFVDKGRYFCRFFS
jgi:hypothetical protein